MSNVVSFTAHTWASMLAQPAPYAFAIERLVGFWLLHGKREDEDFDMFNELALAAVPGLAKMSDIEREFVIAGATHVLYADDPGGQVRIWASDWFREGGQV